MNLQNYFYKFYIVYQNTLYQIKKFLFLKFYVKKSITRPEPHPRSINFVKFFSFNIFLRKLRNNMDMEYYLTFHYYLKN